MKELSIEEKAKRYDEAIKVAADIKAGTATYITDGTPVVDAIFPEFKSEDEKIRKALVEMVHDTTGDELWVDYNVHKEEALAWLEKQGEQKPADKVEPKFHEREWITNGDYTWQIVSVTDLDYILRSQDGNTVDDTISHVDEQFHSFTIEDAKAGDVLIDNYNNVVMYQEPCSNLLYHSFCFVSTKVFVDSGGSHFIEGTYPATKEQRDLLFQKMKEAGYEWDAEKKELKKIEQPKLTEFEDAIKDMIDDYRDAIDDNAATVEEVKEHAAYLLSLIPQKPAEWSKEDDYNLQCMIAKVTSDIQKGNVGRNQELIDWLKTFKDRVQPQQIQEWSEEDVLAIKRIIDTIQCAQLTRNGKPRALYTDEILDNLVNWLKSLRPQNRWKPSEEQMKALTFACVKNADIDKSTIKALYDLKEQLKKLMEE